MYLIFCIFIIQYKMINSDCSVNNDIYPNYGPLNGGTLITFTSISCLQDSINLDSKSYLLLGNKYQCNLSSRSTPQEKYILKNDGDFYNNAASWITPAFDANDLQRALNVSACNHATGCRLIDGVRYTPKPQPSFNYSRKVESAGTILSGGIVQIFYGKNFDSVANPYLNIHVFSSESNFDNFFYDGYISLGNKMQAICKVNADGTQLVCSTPRLDLYSNLDFADDDRYTAYLKPVLGAIDAEAIDISDAIKSDYFKVRVYRNPEVEQFDPLTMPLADRKKLIPVKGSGLLDGCSSADYKITVADVDAKIETVSNYLIAFYAPDEQPPPASTDLNNARRVVVRVGNFYKPVGYIQYNEDAFSPYIWIGVALAIVILLAVIVLISISVYRRRSRASAPKKSEIEKFAKQILIPIPANLKTKTLNAKKLIIQKELSKGHYGQVLLANYNNQQVAVKTLMFDKSNLNATNLTRVREEINNIYKEAIVMKDVTHPNVLSLVGILLDSSNLPCLILPYIPNGDLKTYLKTSNALALKDLLSFAMDILKGMEYLTSKGIIHRDLAARNCMVDDALKIQICDFGLSRTIEADAEYYRPTNQHVELPIKWLALECFDEDDRKFSEKSDVWSFGVLMWEILTYGCTPYPNVYAVLMLEHLRQGNRLENPGIENQLFESLMSVCWNENPSDRPTFTSLRIYLENYVRVGDGGYLVPNNR